MNDIWVEIFYYLPAKVIISFSRINKFLLRCSRNNNLWKEVYIIQVKTNKYLERRAPLIHVHFTEGYFNCPEYFEDPRIRSKFDEWITLPSLDSIKDKQFTERFSIGDLIWKCCSESDYLIFDGESFIPCRDNRHIRKKGKFPFEYWCKVFEYSRINLNPFLDQLMANLKIVFINSYDILEYKSIEECKEIKITKEMRDNIFIESYLIHNYCAYFIYISLHNIVNISAFIQNRERIRNYYVYNTHEPREHADKRLILPQRKNRVIFCAFNLNNNDIDVIDFNSDI